MPPHPKSYAGGRGQPSRGGGSPSPVGSSLIQYPLPRDLADLYRIQNKSVFNPAVIFDRFSPDLSSAGNKKEEWRKQALQAASVQPDANALKAYCSRWEDLAQALGAQPFEMKTDWRFVPGLGRKTALEIGFNFHRYGFPCLPGSAVKGIARTVALFELAETIELSAEPPDALNHLDQILTLPEDEFKKEINRHQRWSRLAAHKEQADRFRAVFGTLEAAGGAIFFEAIPAEAFSLEVDIMNPHFAPYYQGKEPPADWHNPVPVAFLTVPAGKPFRFAVGWRRGAKGENRAATASEWLKKGLLEIGAGAKTAAGYGYFK